MNPFACVESSVVPSAANTAAPATAGILKKEVRFEEAGKNREKKKSKGEGEGKGKPSEPTKPELEEKRKGAKLRFKDIPASWFVTKSNATGGYQCRTEVSIYGRLVPTMLDTCAGCNSCTEEMVCGLLLDDSLKPSDPNFPLVQLEKWPTKWSLDWPRTSRSRCAEGLC